MDNDEIAGAIDLCDFRGKEGIGFVVSDPEGVGGRDSSSGIEPEKVVEERPKSLTSASSDKATHSSCRNPHSDPCSRPPEGIPERISAFHHSPPRSRLR